MSDTTTAIAVMETDGHGRQSIAPRREPDYAEYLALAEQLVTTGFLPAAVKTPAQAVAIMLTGRELGIPTMHALRSIHIIQGRPCLAAELQLALFHRKAGMSLVLKSTNESCVMKFRHPNGMEHEETFTIEDARRADLLGKDGWKKYPRAMLRARTISAGLRIAAPEIVAGIYDPEELGADYDEHGGVVMPALVAPAPEPPKAATPEPTKQATEAQITRICQLTEERDLTHDQIAKIEEALERPISQRRAQKWIEDLERLPHRPAAVAPAAPEGQ